MRNRRKIQTAVSNRRSSGGLEAARSRYISRAIKEGRTAEVRFANTAAFKTQYNQEVRKNIISRTNKQINQIVSNQNIGSEGKKLLRRTLSKKLGTKATLNSVKKAAKSIAKKGLKSFVNRKGFVRGISAPTRKSMSPLELLRLQERGEFYFKERELILEYNDDRGNENLEREVKKRYKAHKSEQLSEFMEEMYRNA